MARKAIPHVTAIRLTRATKLLLREIAKNERRTQNDVIQRALLDYAFNQKKDKASNVQR